MVQSVLSGDIGGTKTLLQLSAANCEQKNQKFKRYYLNRNYGSFIDILNDFLAQPEVIAVNHCPVAACFAVAGPIVAQQAKLTNLPWAVSAANISDLLTISNVKLINDFEAVALAVESCPVGELVTLQTGNSQPGTMRVVLGAGTGMGVAWLSWQKDRYVPLSTEAGHVDFAPVNQLQIGLLEVLQKKFGHVSIERVLSGPGLSNIFEYLLHHSSVQGKAAGIDLSQIDSSVAISQLAIEHQDPIAIRSLELFVEIYGAYAGNLALSGLCRNGVYIAGGIAPKIIDFIKSGSFMRAFCDKGRFAALMKEIPVHVMINSLVGLLGAEKEAQRLALKEG